MRFFSYSFAFSSVLTLTAARSIKVPVPSRLQKLLPDVASSSPLPLIIWHGLGDNYDNPRIHDVAALANATNPDTFVYTVKLGDDPSADQRATFVGNLTEQLAQVCADIASHPVLSVAPAVNALGFSQGGQFLRGYVERCNNPPVRSLVTLGSQHAGIAKFKGCGATDFLCKGAQAVLRANAWTAWAQSNVVPAQYYRVVNESTAIPTEEYRANSNFIADVNGESCMRAEDGAGGCVVGKDGEVVVYRNETYKKNLKQLQAFALYRFAEDTVVIPRDTSWFATVANLSDEKHSTIPLRKSAMYEQDWLGLKELDEEGRLFFREVPGEHMRLRDEDLVELFKNFFAPGDVQVRSTDDEVASVAGAREERRLQDKQRQYESIIRYDGDDDEKSLSSRLWQKVVGMEL